jgi:hypothetical protein
MGRYAGSGKATVEGCRSIDVLDWYRRGYLQSPRWFSWAWSQGGSAWRRSMSRLLIPTKSPRHSEMMSPGIPT